MIRWRKDVAKHDFDAALAYLSLRLATSHHAAEAVGRLREAKITTRRANDILRAARLDPAPLTDPGVLKDLIKVARGEKLSPVLLVNQPLGVEIADGYHRVSLVYALDPFGDVPLRLA